MMVRSAPNTVSKTASKPTRFNAVTILPDISVPGGNPHSSPIVTEIEGAT